MLQGNPLHFCMICMYYAPHLSCAVHMSPALTYTVLYYTVLPCTMLPTCPVLYTCVHYTILTYCDTRACLSDSAIDTFGPEATGSNLPSSGVLPHYTFLS